MEHRRLWALTGVALAMLSAQGAPLAQTAASATAAASEATAPAEQTAFSEEQIDQMVAPIALYPDALLAQVLMSSTYPLEIVQAARWQKKNESLKDEALDTALREQSWDPSVKTMVMFPTVLQRMNENLDWTQDLGDAFLAQEQDVMDAVQRLRREAQKTGALKDTPQQKVVVEKETIVVEPSDPQTVYVPTYDPSVVYGQPAPATQYYPTVYQQPVSTTSTGDQWVSFGAGALVGGLLTAAIMWDDDDDWHGYHVWNHGPGYWDAGWPGPRYGSSGWNSWRGNTNINGDVCVGRCTNIERNEWRQNANRFEHNVEHRGGVKYREGNKVATRYPEVNRARPGGIDRDTARGKARPTTLPAQSRPGDRAQIGGVDRRPGDMAKPGERPQLGGGDRERPSAKPGDRPQVGGGDRARPEARPAERPKVASADRPKAETRPAQRPQAETRPAQRPQQQQFKAPERSVAQASKASRPTAFQSGGSGSFERQASARGAASRNSGGMHGGGGGGARGGGAAPRGGGGARGGGGRGR